MEKRLHFQQQDKKGGDTDLGWTSDTRISRTAFRRRKKFCLTRLTESSAMMQTRFFRHVAKIVFFMTSSSVNYKNKTQNNVTSY